LTRLSNAFIPFSAVRLEKEKVEERKTSLIDHCPGMSVIFYGVSEQAVNECEHEMKSEHAESQVAMLCLP
jgi:hypothetical protein